MHGKWNKNRRQDFSGTIGANCKGTMRFPDFREFYTLEYDPRLKKIFWNGTKSGNVWKKGRLEKKKRYNLPSNVCATRKREK